MSSFESRQGPLERNLIFVGLALEKGLIEIHHITHAFTVWICDKTQSLGTILVKIGSLTEAQKLELDRGVEQRLGEDLPSVQAVSELENLEDITSHLDFLRDEDLDRLLDKAVSERRLHLSGLKQAYEDRGSAEQAPGEGFFERNEGKESSNRFRWKEALPEPSGMGELSVALDKELNRLVVVKKIKPNRAADPLYRGLFRLEGEVTGHLEHPNIPPVYSLNKDSQGRDFFAMRYFKGKKLTEAIREYHALPRAERGKRKRKLIELLQSFQTACLAVEFAHHRGVLHCDLKPDNILVGPYGETLVIDWGLVFVTSASRNPVNDLKEAPAVDPDSDHYAPSKGALTGLHERQGGLRHTVGGTLPYLAPEQLRASRTKEIEKITTATDVFLLGSTLYHLLTNRPPYIPKTKDNETASDLYDRVLRADCPPPRATHPEIPKPLEAIVRKAMRLDPGERYRSPRDLADDVRRWLSGEPTIAYREGMAEKAERWFKKNRRLVSVTASSLLGAALLGGLLLFWEQQRTLAALAQLEIIAWAGFKIVEEFEPMIVSNASLNDDRRNLLIDSMLAYRKILKYYPSESKTKLAAATVFRYVANIYRSDFNEGQAKPLYEEAIKIYKDGLEESEDRDLLSLKLSQTLLDYGQLHMLVGDVQAATRMTEAARTEIENHFGSDSNPVGVARLRCLSLLSLAGISCYRGNFERCETEGKAAVDLLNKIKEKGIEDGQKILKKYDPIFMASALTYLGTSARERNDLEQSEKMLAQARELMAPYITDLRGYDQSVVREVSKLDVLLVTLDVRVEQNLTWLEIGKDMKVVKDSIDEVVRQAEAMVKHYPESPKFHFCLCRALIARVAYHGKCNDASAASDFACAQKILSRIAAKKPNLEPVAEYHLRALVKAKNGSRKESLMAK